MDRFPWNFSGPTLSCEFASPSCQTPHFSPVSVKFSDWGENTCFDTIGAKNFLPRTTTVFFCVLTAQFFDSIPCSRDPNWRKLQLISFSQPYRFELDRISILHTCRLFSSFFYLELDLDLFKERRKSVEDCVASDLHSEGINQCRCFRGQSQDSIARLTDWIGDFRFLDAG